MLNKFTKSQAGFTLVEIMIVVAIIALLAAIAVPNFLRARKRSQATAIINDLRQLDAAMDQYSIDTGKLSGFTPTFADLQNYLKTDTNLYSSGADLFGDTYGPFTVDSIPQVPTSAFNTLSDVADASFWGQYYDNSGDDSGGGSAPASTPSPQLAQAQANLASAQSYFNSVEAQYNADIAANIGGQARKDITYEYEAAQQQLQAAETAYTQAGGSQ